MQWTASSLVQVMAYCPFWHHIYTLTNVDFLFIGCTGINFRKIWVKTQLFSFKKMFFCCLQNSSNFFAGLMYSGMWLELHHQDALSPVPLKQPRWIWVNGSYKSTGKWKYRCRKSTDKHCVYSMHYAVEIFYQWFSTDPEPNHTLTWAMPQLPKACR